MAIVDRLIAPICIGDALLRLFLLLSLSIVFLKMTRLKLVFHGFVSPQSRKGEGTYGNFEQYKIIFC